MIKQKTVHKVGWFASFFGICMFFSFLDQIRLNVTGHPGSVILPLATFINCSTWTIYGYLKEIKDWPLIVSNGLGVVVSILTAMTAILFG
ncbi:MAG: SWEET family sugar transporter [Spirochaetaceae bacterium]